MKNLDSLIKMCEKHKLEITIDFKNNIVSVTTEDNICWQHENPDLIINEIENYFE